MIESKKIIKPYMPSSGTEGRMFLEFTCDGCYKRWGYFEGESKPTCTSWASRPIKKNKNGTMDLFA